MQCAAKSFRRDEETGTNPSHSAMVFPESVSRLVAGESNDPPGMGTTSARRSDSPKYLWQRTRKTRRDRPGGSVRAGEVVESLLLDSDERCRLLGFARNRYGIRREAAQDVLQETAVQLLVSESAEHPWTFEFGKELDQSGKRLARCSRGRCDHPHPIEHLCVTGRPRLWPSPPHGQLGLTKAGTSPPPRRTTFGSCPCFRLLTALRSQGAYATAAVQITNFIGRRN